MAQINLVRVLLGGLVAGAVLNLGEFLLNGLILSEQWDAAMEDLSRLPIGGGAVAVQRG